MDLHTLTLHELHTLLKDKEISSRELTAALLNHIESVEPKVKAYLKVTGEEALTKAEEVDKRLAQEELGPLAGIPMALKDNMCTEGITTTCASQILHNFNPPYSATVAEKLDREGTVLLGKLNMDEFAMGSSNENSSYYPVRNPWDLERAPGGSSGGATAAVAAGEACFTLGSDTGGSIRQPASFCGVVGMKPTYGRVSRYGLIAFASSLDQIGPVTKDVRDCALVLQAIAGYDEKDSTSADLPVPDYLTGLQNDIRGMRIGIPKEYFTQGLEEGVRQAVEAAIKQLEELGAVCEEMSLPHTEYALPAYYLVAPAEASSNLARYDGVRYGHRAQDAQDVIGMFKKTRSEGFGAEVKRRIMLGTYALSSGYYDAYYLKALKVRTLIRQDFDRAFAQYDAVVAPTAPTVAFKIGEKSGDPLAMYLSDLFTIPVNMAGLPALSLPCGFSDGMPVGLQIIGKPFDEATLLQVAYNYEQSTPHHRLRPKVEVG